MTHGKAGSDRPGAAGVVETARLRLRPFVAADVDARMAMAGDSAVMAAIGGPQTREESWHRVLRHAGHWALFGWGLFAIEDRADGAFLGECGLGRFERGLGAGFDDTPEAAWCLAAAAQGRGIAAEAMAAALDWYARRIDVRRTVCLIDPANRASLALADRLGYRPYDEAVYRARPSLLLERCVPFP